MSISLPEKELDWSDEGAAGAYRFLKRVHTLVGEAKGSISMKPRPKPAAPILSVFSATCVPLPVYVALPGQDGRVRLEYLDL